VALAWLGRAARAAPAPLQPFPRTLCSLYKNHWFISCAHAQAQGHSLAGAAPPPQLRWRVANGPAMGPPRWQTPRRGPQVPHLPPTLPTVGGQCLQYHLPGAIAMSAGLEATSSARRAPGGTHLHEPHTPTRSWAPKTLSPARPAPWCALRTTTRTARSTRCIKSRNKTTESASAAGVWGARRRAPERLSARASPKHPPHTSTAAPPSGPDHCSGAAPGADCRITFI